YHTLATPGSGVDIEQLVCTFREPLAVRHLVCAWNTVTRRHQALRAGFSWSPHHDPSQTIHASLAIAIDELDWRSLPDQGQDARLAEFLVEDRQRGFDLSQPPLFRLACVRMADENYTLVCTFHHILIDGRSISIVVGEVLTLYDALSSGEEITLEPPAPYTTFLDRVEQRQDSSTES